jgi:hypothetical protein
MIVVLVKPKFEGMNVNNDGNDDDDDDDDDVYVISVVESYTYALIDDATKMNEENSRTFIPYPTSSFTHTV